MKKFLSLLALVLALALCPLSLSAESASAAEEEGVRVTVQNCETMQGDNVYLRISIEGAEELSMIELALSYDATAFEYGDAYTGGLLPSDTLTEINGTQAGIVSLYALSAGGFSGDGCLWEVRLYTKDSAPVGRYSVQLFAGDCCDKTLAPVAVTASGAGITVKARPQNVRWIYVYGNASQWGLHRGDSVTVSFYSYDLYGLAAAEMEIDYDDDLLSLNGVQMGSQMLADGQASVNSDRSGYVKISYIAMNGVKSGTDFLSLTFTVLADTDANTTVTLTMSGLCDASLAPMAAGETRVGLTLFRTQEETVPPEIGIADLSVEGETFTVSVIAEGETHLAAGDFVVSYNPYLLVCTEATGNSSYFTVINNQKDKGKVSFSFIAEDGISEDTALVTLTFQKIFEDPFDTMLSLDGTDLADAAIKPITANVHGGLVHFLCHVWESRSAKAATCTESGHSAYEECTVCGSRRGYVEEAAKGHKEEIIPQKEPTCTESGSTQGSKCSVCNEILDEPQEIPANGHTMSEVEGRDPTCTDAGELHHFHCSACNLNFGDMAGEQPLSEIGIPANGHHYGDPSWEWNGYTSATATFTCDRCDESTNGHTMSVTENAVRGARVDATCTEGGSQKYTVTVHFRDQEDTDERTEQLSIDSSNHTHLTSYPQQDPTCTEVGYEQYYVCDGCHRMYRDAGGKTPIDAPIEIPASGHNYGEWHSAGEGKEQRTCEACGVTEERDGGFGIAEQFREKVAAIGKAGSSVQKFEAIKLAAEAWNDMPAWARKTVQDTYLTLEAEIAAYNSAAEEVNGAHEAAVGITKAVASALAGLSELAAAWYVGKGLYLGGIV